MTGLLAQSVQGASGVLSAAPAAAKPTATIKKGPATMEALLPILIFVVAVIAVNVYEFGRPD